MAKKFFRKTFSFSKLSNKLDKIIVDQINALSRHINNAIQENTKKGIGIDLETGKAKKFKELEPTTIKLHGSHTPLNVTGKLRETKITPARVDNNPKAIITMVNRYGAYHHTGFEQTNPKQWFHPKKVKARPWFGIHESVRPGGKHWKKAQLEMSLRIKQAWKK